MELNEGLEEIGRDRYVYGTGIEQGVFLDNAVEEINIPSTLQIINCDAFKNCKNLRKINFSEGLKRIESYCFAGSGVEEIVFPESLVDISDSAFEGCTNLRSIVFGKNS